MRYRKLGKTGLSVSEIALGCSGFENNKEREKVCAEMHYAMERGINFLDLFASEPALRDSIGAAIAGRRDKIIIQGHIGSALHDGQYQRTRDMDLTKEYFEDLLKRLGTDYVDIGMIHYVDSVEDWEGIKNGPFLEYILELKQSKKILHIGMSSHNPVVSIEAIKSGMIDVLMFAVNPCYDMQPGDEDVEKIWADESYENPLRNQDAARKELYELCESMGVGIDIMKIYGGGDLLTAEMSPFGKAFTPVQCIHYALTRPAAAAVMVGCKNTDEIDAALAYPDATDAERDYTGVLSGMDKFTFSGHCLYCGHCAPCPSGIDVAAVTKFLNICLARDSVPDTERGHYELLGHHAGECIACGHCEKNCPFDVKVIDNMAKAAELFGF